MPELPEVETTRLGLLPHIKGAVVQLIKIHQPVLRWPVPVQDILNVQGSHLLDITRRGKYLLFKFDHGTVLWHLGMSGSLRLDEPQQSVKKHDHVEWLFGCGRVLRFNDPRRFGALLWTQYAVEKHPLLKKLGPEPLDADITGEWLYQHTRQVSTSIKLWLMNGQKWVGVGNIYANEALFASGIHPLTSAGKLSLKRCEYLVFQVKKILQEAITQGGTTLRDFVGGDGKPGYFSQSLNVYGRGGLPCVKCSKPLTEIKLGQRTTVYCVKCQT